MVPNRPGLLAELTEVLAARGIDIAQIVVETHDAGAVVRMEVEDEDAALGVLTDAGYHAVSDDVLLARIEDRPGSLAALSRRLADARLDIRSLHHVRRESGFALVAVSTDDNLRARELLGPAAV
ncbi:MAG TPA: ACT domain-containing protein [Candidatus Aquilonibacter sp.]|nr:ACT domain-containing protein [Candidatus Aquilonibacter sp.]